MIRFIFYGNYFYGICAVALAIEASLQQQFPLNEWPFYLAIFLATVLYYTKAYLTEGGAESTNPRTQWYVEHRNMIWWSQLAYTCLLLVCAIYLFIQIDPRLFGQMGLLNWILVLVFPVVGALYYGLNAGVLGQVNIRSIGWFKPFFIGFSWAGLVNFYPIWYHEMANGQVLVINMTSILLFIKNCMYVSVLCIMFDIKDYASDYNSRIKTFVVALGLRKTIFYILIPLCVLGVGSFIGLALARHFSTFKILLNTIPFILLIGIAYSLQQRRSILFYLIVIDGLMLVKALCGSLAMLYF
jgi:hypothetical protein